MNNCILCSEWPILLVLCIVIVMFLISRVLLIFMILPVALSTLSNLLVGFSLLVDLVLIFVLFRPLSMGNKCCSTTWASPIYCASIAGKTIGGVYGGPESSSGVVYSWQSKDLVCVQPDEIIYNTFVLRYSGTEYYIGFPFASGKSTSSSCATVGGSA